MSLLTVRTMAKLSGVSAHTLRAWEKRYGAIKPARTTGGQRSYNMSELERLRKLKKLTDLGFAIGQIARLPDSELDKISEPSKPKPSMHELPRPQTMAQPSITVAPLVHSITAPIEPLEELINDLAEFRLDEVYRKITQLRIKLGAREFVLGVASPLIKEIGMLVYNNSFSISQEHAFSAILRDQLGHLIQMQKTGVGKDTIVFSTPEGDLHEFGILFGQVLAQVHGLRTHNLGCNLPVESLAFAINAMKIDHVCLSFTQVPPEHTKMSPVDYIRILRKSIPKQTTILVGGTAITEAVRLQIHDDVVYLDSLSELDVMFRRIGATV